MIAESSVRISVKINVYQCKTNIPQDRLIITLDYVVITIIFLRKSWQLKIPRFKRDCQKENGEFLIFCTNQNLPKLSVVLSVLSFCLYIYLVLNYSKIVNNSSEISLAMIKCIFSLLNRSQKRFQNVENSCKLSRNLLQPEQNMWLQLNINLPLNYYIYTKLSV